MLYEVRLLWDDTVCVPTQSCQKYIPSPSLNTDYLLSYWYHAYYSSPEVLHTLWCKLVCRLNTVKLNFVKTGLKFKFGVNPQSFSHALCLYITTFGGVLAGHYGISKTSNNGPSEKRTTSLERTTHLLPIDFTIEYISNLREANTSQLRTTDTDQAPTYLGQYIITSENGQWSYSQIMLTLVDRFRNATVAGFKDLALH